MGGQRRDRLSVASEVSELFVELRRGLDRASIGHEGVLWHRCAGEGALSAAAFVEVPTLHSSPGPG